MQAYNLRMCWYFCIGFIDFMLRDKSLLDYNNRFSSSEYEKNDTKVFSITKKMKKLYCVVCDKYRKFKNHKYHTFSKKH